MMKCEFEEMVGKEVDYETFEMYERMYSVLPEHVNKQQFVEMLNIDNIPESAASIQRKKARIKELHDDIKYAEDEIARYRQYLQDADNTEEDNKMYCKYIRDCRHYIERQRATIREYKFIIE